MYTVELAPGVLTPRHWHPGHYFAYVLEGSGYMEEEGKRLSHCSQEVRITSTQTRRSPRTGTPAEIPARPNRSKCSSC